MVSIITSATRPGRRVGAVADQRDSLREPHDVGRASSTIATSRASGTRRFSGRSAVSRS